MASEPKRTPPEDFDPTPRPVTREAFMEQWEKSIPLEESIARRRKAKPDDG
ncbi:MAG: hypothetical protein H0W70_08995 [Actinobacteria bacterium]|nr:hypothetical protein [Actinomycetota bacterium]